MATVVIKFSVLVFEMSFINWIANCFMVCNMCFLLLGKILAWGNWNFKQVKIFLIHRFGDAEHKKWEIVITKRKSTTRFIFFFLNSYNVKLGLSSSFSSFFIHRCLRTSHDPNVTWQMGILGASECKDIKTVLDWMDLDTCFHTCNC